MNLYAIDKLKKVKVCNEEIISSDWSYKSEIKKKPFLCKERVIQEAGFYENKFGGWGWREIFRGNTFEQPNFVMRQTDGNINIYQKRYVKLIFGENESDTIYFDSSEDLLKFVEEIRQTYLRIFNANLIEDNKQTSLLQI